MSLFDSILRRHESERHGAILAGLARSRGERQRAADDANDGFQPERRAARTMGIELEELHDLVRTGMLEGRRIGGKLHVRPAVVSRMAVEQT